MNDDTLKRIKLLFIAGAIWNLLGAAFGYFNTNWTFALFFGRELSDPLIHQIYQGAWGTTLFYFFGYLIVAHAPLRHPGIVIVGGIGKLGYAIKLAQLLFAGLAKPVVLIVIIGDLVFVTLFVLYFVLLRRARRPIV